MIPLGVVGYPQANAKSGSDPHRHFRKISDINESKNVLSPDSFPTSDQPKAKASFRRRARSVSNKFLPRRNGSEDLKISKPTRDDPNSIPSTATPSAETLVSSPDLRNQLFPPSLNSSLAHLPKPGAHSDDTVPAKKDEGFLNSVSIKSGRDSCELLTPSESTATSTSEAIRATLAAPRPTAARNPGSMARREPSKSRASTFDSNTSAPSPSQLGLRNGNAGFHSNMNNSSQTSLHRIGGQDAEPLSAASRTPGSVAPPGGPSPAMAQTAGTGTSSNPNSTSGLSGLVCNVHRTTGREPHPLVGATTTVLGDKLYVFGGRRLSRTKPQLTADLYELDLIKRHWTKLDVKGDIPPPRYFHSVCPLGDKKLVCYGGMSPARPLSGQTPQSQTGQDGQPEVVVMSDIHIYDVPSRTWMNIQSPDPPQGRYAHCASILPSSAIFSSESATKSAIQHNPSSSNPNQGSLGVSLDGTGGAEMVVVGGQDSANHYIEQVSVFNLRSLQWTTTTPLGKACGAYRSVVAPLSSMDVSSIGASQVGEDLPLEEKMSRGNPDGSSSMLIYSNYNFLDVKLELQVRLPDGTLTEKSMHGTYSPPGLRFPNGGVINNHFVVSGTFLTSSKQEYALWALDLRTLNWSKIDASGNVFSQGSWNRGVLWARRNTFVILGNRKRSLVDDYNHRRINFTNVCMVELEAFGLYDNPRKTSPLSRYMSVSAPVQTAKLDHNAGGRQLSTAAEELGAFAMNIRELNDMDIMSLEEERIPVNSHLIARRWGPYFNVLLREGISTAENTDTATLRPSGLSTHPSRNSSITITPSVKTAYSNATTLTNNTLNTINPSSSSRPWDPPDINAGPHASTRSRTLYLPHTKLTIHALVHYLYTSNLPHPSSPLCTPQILCSLLQIARPYQIDGLLEAIVDRQHAVLDGRNTAAIFNAAAMAAGGGVGVGFTSSPSQILAQPDALSAAELRERDEDIDLDLELHDEYNTTIAAGAGAPGTTPTVQSTLANLRINTDLLRQAGRRGSDDELSNVSASTSSSQLSVDLSGLGTEREIWAGEISAVVGLQKRGLRGLMEGRRLRELRGGNGQAEASRDAVGLGLMGERLWRQLQPTPKTFGSPPSESPVSSRPFSGLEHRAAIRNPRPTEQRKLILRFKLGSKKGTRNIFRFLELPAELRNYIYELLLTGTKGRLAIDVSDFFNFHFDWPESDLRNCRVAREYEYRSRIFRHPVYPLILAVNRQIHAEATPILYHNRFSLDSFRDFNFFCRDIGDHRRHLRYIDVGTGVDDYYFPFEHPDDLANLRKVTLDILLYEQETGTDNAYNWFTGCVGGWMKAMLLKKGDIASVLEILHIENCRVCDIEGMEDPRELETEKIAEFEKDFKGELADLLVKDEEDEEEEDEDEEDEEDEEAEEEGEEIA